MDTQRFFLKAAGISLAKVAGISLALVMAFAMFAGCEQDTKIVYRTPENTDPGNNGPSTQQPVYPPAAAKVPNSTAELEALINAEETKPIYITKPLELTGDVTVKDGMKLVIATEEYAIRHPTGSAGLLAATYSPTSGYGKLTVAKGATLRVASGGSVVVGNTDATGNTGVLEIADGGKFHVPAGATLAVTVGSHIVVVAPAEGTDAAPNTGLFIDDGAKLAIVGLTASTTVSGKPVEEGATVEPVIVIPARAPAVIDVKADDIYTNEKADAPAPAETADKVVTDAGTATADSPAQSTDSVDGTNGVIALLGSTATTVTYTGPGPLTGVTVPNGKALIITGGTTGKIAQTAAITVQDGGTLEVATGATVTVSGSGSITGAGSDTKTVKLVVAPGASVVVDPTSDGDAADLAAAEGKVNINSTGDITTNVSKIYTLPTEAGGGPKESPAGVPVNSALLTATAIKNLATTGEGAGLVTITLGGRTDSDIPYSADPNSVYYDMFDTQEVSKILIADRAARGYSAVVIENLVTYASPGKIKQYNQGLNMWNANVPGHSENITGYDTPDVYKEKTYSGGNFYPTAIGGYDIILWDGADRKTITLEVYQPSSETKPTNTFLIDYSGVTFTGPTGTGKTVSDPNQVSWTGAIKTVTYTGSDALVGPFSNLPADATLVIAGKIANQTAPITIGNLEIAPTGELTTSGTISAGTLATIAGSLTTSAPILAGTLSNANNGYIAISAGTISTTLLTNSGLLKTTTETTATTLTNDGTIETEAAINATTLTNSNTITTSAAINATTLTNNQTTGIINLGQYGTITGVTTVANNGTIKTKNTGAFATLVGITNTGTGNVLLEAAVSSVTPPLTLNTNLEIGQSGGITFTDVAQPAFIVNAAKTVTITSDNNGTALTLPTSITGYGANVTVVNNGRHATAAITTATASGDALKNILTAGGNITATGSFAIDTGTTVQGGTTLTVSGTLTNSTTDFTVNGTIELGTNGGITNTGTINLGTGDGTISPYNKVTNTGTIKTAKGDGSTLVALLDGTNGVQAGTVQVDGANVTLSNNAAVKAGVTLSIPFEKKLTVASDTLDLSALFTPGNPGTSNGTVTLAGELVIGSGGTLRLSMGNGSGVIPEITYSNDGSLKIEKDGSVKLDHPTPDTADVTYIGTSGLYEWGADQTGITDPHVLLKGDGMTLHANLTSAQNNFIFDEVTIDGDATLTIAGAEAQASGKTLDISGSVVVKGTLDIGAYAGIGIVRDGTAKLQLDPGGQVKVAQTGTITVYDWIDGSNIKVAVYKKSVNLTDKTQATASESSPSSGDWTVTTANSGGAAASDITLGKLKITIPASSAVVGGTTTWVSGTAGSLTADKTSDTVIVFTAHDN